MECPPLVNLNESFSLGNNKKIKANRNEKVQIHEKNNKKKYKTKINYLELSDEFFLEKSFEVSFFTNI